MFISLVYTLELLNQEKVFHLTEKKKKDHRCIWIDIYKNNNMWVIFKQHSEKFTWHTLMKSGFSRFM